MTIFKPLFLIILPTLHVKEVYVEQGMLNYEQTYKAKLVHGLEKRANELGYSVVLKKSMCWVKLFLGMRRKARTRHLISMGGLVAKAKLDDLPSNSLLGGLISLKNELICNPDIKDRWTKTGKNIFDKLKS